jgi:hypothetical protein
MRSLGRVFSVAALLALAGASEARAQCLYYVAPTGSDANPGTVAQPWATLNHASAQVLAGGGSNCIVSFADGVYTGPNSLYERFATPTTFRAANPYRAVLQNSGTAVSLFGARNMVFEGFEFRHAGPGASPLVVQVQQDGTSWAEEITFRNNVFHDSWNNDILKINNGARFITVETNVFYNQTGSDEHMDVNSVTDVVIQDNVFFNDFAGSGRVNANDTSSFIVIKDSNGNDDGLLGSERITVRRNVFLGWQGSGGSNFVLVGEDGNAYFEGKDVLVENNLMIGNAPNVMRAAFGVKGGRNVTFRSNTVVGDLPSLAYALRLNREGSNPVNENVFFHDNVWSDPTGTMGADGAGSGNDFSDGLPAETTNLRLDRNLYWNGGQAIPPGDVASPLVHDARRIVADPGLSTNQGSVVLPRWNGSTFVSGNATVRQEFVRLVNLYGAIPAGSPAQNQADPALSAADDILGRSRSTPDLGAFEVTPVALRIQDLAVSEGNTSTTSALVTVSLSTASASVVTVNWSTADATALAGADYAAASGLLTFPAGSTSQAAAVPVLGDLLPEPNERFLVNLGGATNATIADGQGVVTLLDDESTRYFTVAPCRVADTRNAAGPAGGPALQANTSRSFAAAGACGIPASAKAAAVNVTVTGATVAGDLRLYPADAALPLASTINFGPEKTLANNAVVRLGTAAAVAVRCDMPAGSTGSTHFILDVTGYFE